METLTKSLFSIVTTAKADKSANHVALPAQVYQKYLLALKIGIGCLVHEWTYPYPKKRITTALTTYLMGIVLLFTQCESPADSEVQPAKNGNPTSKAARVASNLQTITTVDGAIAQVECTVETMDSGEIYQICIPANWNGELILYAHGYVSEFEPLRLPQEAATYIPLYTSLGFAFATTSYSQNGLAIQSGIQDMLRLRKAFMDKHGEPKQIYLTGASEGGIITTLAIERYPELFSGGLSLCGPCGYFQGQINYYGNFRVLFDYFFKGVLPGNAVNIPDELIANWQTVYVPAVLEAIRLHPATTLKLLNTAQAPYDPNDPATIGQTVLNVLWYDVFTTRDAIRKLGGQPFDNRKKLFIGTGSIREDLELNLKVQRFSADRAATENIRRNYETSGNLSKPLVIGHTTKDPIQLFWHLPLYRYKVNRQGKSSLFSGVPVERYGHCTFTEAEIASGFTALLQKIKGQVPVQAQQLIAKANTTDGKLVQSVRKQ